MTGRQRILVVYTGGTIGMAKTESGYRPAHGFLQEQMAAMTELQATELPSYEVVEHVPLIDSSNMSPEMWRNIAARIVENYDAFDGFIVLHGTDTMAYTASALAFLLEGLAKPVILTGSQIPLCEVRNDARRNLVTSLQLAADPRIREVCLLFGNSLFRGCRVSKVHASGFEAFDSPNFPALGRIGTEVRLAEDLLHQPIDGCRLRVAEMGEAKVAALRLFPGISADILANFLSAPLQGLVLEAYGCGNGPDAGALLEVVRAATARGVVIVVCTQCERGSVVLDQYATGRALAEAGCVSGFDLTPEAALAKLYWLIATGADPKRACSDMQRNVRGELGPAAAPWT